MKNFLTKRNRFSPGTPWIAPEAPYLQTDPGFPDRSNLLRQNRQEVKKDRRDLFIRVCNDMELNAGNAGSASFRFFYIDSFVRDVLEFDELAFSFSLNGNGDVERLEEHGLGRYFFDLDEYRHYDVEGMAFEIHALSPSVLFFLKVLEDCNLNCEAFSYWPKQPSERLPRHPWKTEMHEENDPLPGSGESSPVASKATPVYMGEVFNDFLVELRQRARADELTRQESRRDDKVKRAQKSMLTYLDSLFDKRSGYTQLLVLRLDLGYRDDYSQTVTVEQAKKDWSVFTNRARFNKAFEHVVGGIWKLEWALKKNHHFHCLFFLDVSIALNEQFHAEQIGECWKRVAPKGTGHVHISNLDEFRRRALGMIEASDTEKRGYLAEHLAYLARKDQSLQIKLGPKTRTFDKWKTPKARSNRTGQPRTKATKTEAS